MPSNDEIVQVIFEVKQQLAVQAERERHTRESISELAKEVENLRNEISEMKVMANKWKGGFLVLTALGGIIGWLLSSWSSLTDLLGR